MTDFVRAAFEAAAPELEPEQVADHDWARVDLTGIAAEMRSGTWTPTLPTIVPVEGSSPLFYAGRINQVFGESGSGKTWVALAAVRDVVRAGERALVVDYEDVAAGLVERLIRGLDLTDAELELVDYRHPSSGILRGVEYFQHHKGGIPDVYKLVVFDSTGEAMAAGGVKANDDAEVAGWFSLLKEFAERAGDSAVLVIDHIPKATDAPAGYAIGSQRKRAAITGAGYRVDVITPFAKGRAGKIKLTVAKDRLGNRPMGDIAAEVDVNTTGSDGVELRFHASDAQLARANGERFRPTTLMERVSRWLEQNPGSSRRQTRDNVSGQAKAVETAVDVLIDEGAISVEPGSHGAKLLTVVRRYRADDDVMPADHVDQTTPDATPLPLLDEQVDDPYDVF